MRKTPFLFAVIFLAVGTMSYVLFASALGTPDDWRWSDPAGVPAAPRNAATGTALALAADDADDQAPNSQAGDPGGAGELAAEPGRVELAGDQRRSPLTVMVFAERRGVPAVGAEVFFVDLSRGSARWPNGAGDRHWSELAVAKGQRFRTDQDGRVRLPPVADMAMVTARVAGLYGFRNIRRRHKEIEEIILIPDETLTVRVVDDAGDGVAEVPVAVHQWVPRRAPRGRRAWRQRGERRGRRGRQSTAKAAQPNTAASRRPDLRVQRRSDAAGVVRFEHFQLYRRNPDKQWAKDLHDKFQVVLAVPLARPVAATFQGRPVPAEALVLTMPATGSVALQVVDHEGAPFLHPSHAELRTAGSKTPLPRLGVRKPQGRGLIEFPFVGLGLRLQPRVWLDDEDFTWHAEVAAGPTRAGERITIAVPISEAYGLLRGRLVTGEGAPMAGIRPTFLINGRTGRLEGEELTTGSDGEFQLTFDKGQHEPPFTLEVRHAKDRPPTGITLRIPRLVDGRVIDVGELPMVAMGRVARGSVTDDLGQPVVGARVRLQRQRSVGRGQFRLEWRNETFVQARSAADGQYELFGDPEPGQLRLYVLASGHFPSTTALLRAGSSGNGPALDIVLMRSANLVGTILTPDWVPSNAVRMTLTSVLDPKLRREDRLRDYQGKKYLYLKGVRPGHYDLQVTIAGFPDPVLRVDGLEIQPGQTGVHPRLVDLDVRPYVFRYQVTAIDDASRPLASLRSPLLAKIVRRNGQEEFIGFPWQGSKLEIFSTMRQLDVWQLAAGYRVRRSVIGAGRSQLRFERLPRTKITMPGLRGLVAADVVVRVSTVLDGATGLPSALRVRDQRTGRARSYSRAQLSKSAGAWLRDSDQVSVALMRDGKYSVVARLRRNRTSIPVVLGAIDVKHAAGTVPSFRIPVDAAKIRAGLAKLPPAGGRAPR